MCLKNDDCLIIIQSDFQKRSMIAFANKTICIDTTYNLSKHKYFLITILVLDDFNEGVPVAWAICNREDTELLNFFFTKIKASVGNITTIFFMSDMVNTFFNAWCLTFSTPEFRLWCIWHVERALRSNIKKHANDISIQLNILNYWTFIKNEINLQILFQMLASFKIILTFFVKHFHCTFLPIMLIILNISCGLLCLEEILLYMKICI